MANSFQTRAEQVQYQNLRPNRGIYEGFKFPIAPWAEYPKWVDGPNGARVVVDSAAEERTLVLSRPVGEGETRSQVELDRDRLAGQVQELSRKLAETSADVQLTALAEENRALAKQMREMTSQILTLTAAAKPKEEGVAMAEMQAEGKIESAQAPAPASLDPAKTLLSGKKA